MWTDIEASLDKNEQSKPSPLRPALFQVIRNSELRPGHDTQYMVSFEFGEGERLLWEVRQPENFYLHTKFKSRVEEKGFTGTLKAYQEGGGGRISALDNKWAFDRTDCILIPVESAESLRRLIAVLTQSGDALVLNPAAITRWIERLRHFFPGLDRFDPPDPHFDEAERTYKLEIAAELKTAIELAGSDQDLADAVNTALAKSNLLQWRAYWPMSPKGDADRERLWPALRALVDAALGAQDGHATALEAFVSAWIAAVPDGKPDPARQIAEFLFLHLDPNEGIYIRHSVRQDLWLEAVGSRFPDHASIADTYRDELRFMQAVRRAFAARGLAPRDMIDVQGALWIVHNYKEEDAATLSRDAIEAAMDAYDSYRQSGEHGTLFEAFGEPRDYWVRSTRERPNRVYPSKPIVGFLRGKTQLNGGWGQKADAAAQLHNAGYIIVDADNAPAAPPERYEHLISDAGRIRLCAHNYHVEPARDSGAAEVAIRASDLSRDMGLRDAFPAICSALGGEKFQKLANVPVPRHTLPNPSSSTVFTYQLAAPKGHQIMTFEPTTVMPATTNLILYGPPGTGKTYRTAWEAVRLCLGDQVAMAFQGSEKRELLMAEYRRLVSKGRIEFVTFHQSMSYEEFVEGLRPSTGDGAGEGPEEVVVSTGFRLEPYDGVFKRVSERARLDHLAEGSPNRLNRSARIFKVALGNRQIEQERQRIRFGLDNGLIHVGWGGNVDWSEERFDDFNEIFSEWKLKEPEATGNDGNVVITYSFRADMQVGDYVVVSDGRDRFQAYGEVTGEYFYDQNAEFHPHRRKVKWLWRNDDGVERAQFYPNGFRRHAVYKLNQSLVDWDALEATVLGDGVPRANQSARDHVLIIDEINRANISKVFGELITLLEPDKRIGKPNEISLILPYSKKSFGVPANLHIIGTMNTADRSIALLDTALRRRFTFRELMPDHTVLSKNVGGINLQKLLLTINDRIEYLFDREHQIGHAYFTSCATREDVEGVMRHKVIPLLAEYFYEDWSKVATVLADTRQERPRFLVREDINVPDGIEVETFSGPRQRWRVKPEQDNDINGGFDFSEFEA